MAHEDSTGTPPVHPEGAVSASGTLGSVAATHELAADAARQVLQRGGNAVDAAVAGGFVLHVVEPHLNGPGGDATILLSLRGATPVAVCGQGPAPSRASAAAYRAMGLDLVPGTGPLAAAVPGAVDAWLLLLRDHGTLGLADALAPAIAVAEQGHVPLPRFVALVDQMLAGQFVDHWPTSYAFWSEHRPVGGQPWRNPVLAATWRRLVQEAEGLAGPDADRVAVIEAARRVWSTGFVADALVRSARTPVVDSSGRAHPGMLCHDDLAGWSASYEPTLSATWGRWRLHKAGPWTQGPAFLQQLLMLGDLDPADVDADDPAMRHRLVESTRLVMADRDAWYGDAAALPAELLTEGYAARRRELVGPRASTEWRPGCPGGEVPVVAAHVRRVVGRADAHGPAGAPEQVGVAGTGEPTFRSPAEPQVDPNGSTRGDTCHIAVADRWGTIVAATPSGGWLQSNPTVPELGFPLGTRLQMCWLDDGLPATLTPGRRPRSTLSPTIAELDGVPCLGFGTPGGDQQDQWSFHTFVRVAHLHAGGAPLDADTLGAGIAAPGWHTDHLVGSFWPREFEAASLSVEPDTDPALVAELLGRGHRVQVAPQKTLGRMCMVSRVASGAGGCHAAASTRLGQGAALGVEDAPGASPQG